jgi:hypothetical protein
VNEPRDRVLEAAFAASRDLRPTQAEIARVLTLDTEHAVKARKRRRRTAGIALATLAIATGTYAAPPTRAGVDDVYSWLAPWADGDSAGTDPGRAPSADDRLPNWLPDSTGAIRVLAESDGVKLVVARERGDRVTFLLGGSVGLTESIEHWQRRLAGSGVVVLGPASFPHDRGPLDEHARRPLLGLAARSVTRVELRYASGAPTSQSGVNGGFVLLADATRELREIVGFDASDRQVARADLSKLDLRVCTDVRGCPPGRLQPNR